MEPLVAIGLAANVVQFVDFAASILSKSSELRMSSDGRLIQHRDIAITCNDLSRMTTKLSESIAPATVPIALSEDDQALRGLCEGCLEVSRELQTGLAKIQVHGAASRWKTVRKALKTIWTKEYISELQSGLNDYRRQLNSHILIDIRARLENLDSQQSNTFQTLDDAVKTLIYSFVDSSRRVEQRVEQKAAATEATMALNMRIVQSNVVAAIERSRELEQNDIETVRGGMNGLQTSDQQIVADVQVSRDQILDRVTASAASISEEHEQTKAELTEQWKSAEQQIVQLREEIRQLELRIASSIELAVKNGMKPQDRTRKKGIEDTNLLYKLWVAKDLMLQTLLELVEDIKRCLSHCATFIAPSAWKLYPYERVPSPGDCLSRRQWQNRSAQGSAIERLYEAIENGNAEWIRRQSIPDTIINSTIEVDIDLEGLEQQVAMFYSTIKRDISRAQSRTSQEDVHVYPRVRLSVTPLTWSLFVWQKDQSCKYLAVFDALLCAGANRSTRDGNGLCAFDHARILRFDESVISKLDPFRLNPRILLHAIQIKDHKSVSRLLESVYTPNEFDDNDQSPIALAIHLDWLLVLTELLDAGFSPFAVYVNHNSCYQSLAFSLFQADLDATLHIPKEELVDHYMTWIRSKRSLDNNGVQAICELIKQGLDVVCSSGTAQMYGSDALVLSALLDEYKNGRVCFRYSLSLNVSQVFCAWALYSAIRCGHVKYVAMLSDEAKALELIDFFECGVKSLDCRYALQQWWPWPCQCSVDIHTKSGYPEKHARKLASGLACQYCDVHRGAYAQMVGILVEGHLECRSPLGPVSSNNGGVKARDEHVLLL